MMMVYHLGEELAITACSLSAVEKSHSENAPC